LSPSAEIIYHPVDRVHPVKKTQEVQLANLDFLITHSMSEPFDFPNENPVDIHTLLNGDYCRGMNKRIFVHETDPGEEHSPGLTRPLEMPVIPDLICEWTGIETSLNSNPERILFIDTETTGLSIGAGTYAFLVGFGFFKHNRFLIRQYFLTDPAGEAELVNILTEEIRKFGLLVSFNGKSYDIPLLTSRFVFHGSGFHLRETDHLDLLPISRRIWRATLPGCSLQQLEQSVVQTGRAVESDIPSHLIPGMYFDFLRTANAAPMLNIFYHNRIDIISMVLLLSRISDIVENPFQQGKASHASLFSIARWYQDLGRIQKAIDLYRFCIKEEIDAGQCIRQLSFIYKRQGKMDKAVPLWEAEAARHETYALIELAKVAEHGNKNYPHALLLTRKAIEIESGRPLKDFRIISDLQHRLKRLLRKIG